MAKQSAIGAIPVPVANGGTGAATLTGAVVGNGTSAFTAGTLSVANGGTGATTLTGVLTGNGTSAVTAITYTDATSWTPNVQINSSSTGITYAQQTGFYIQIGNIVFINAVIILTSKGASNGSVTISNLPVITSGNGPQSRVYTLVSKVNMGAGFTMASLNTNATSIIGSFLVTGNNVTETALTDAMLADDSSLFFSGFYMTN